MFDGKAFGEDMVAIVRGYVDRVTAPLLAENKALVERVAALEARQPEKGEPGKDADPAEIERLVNEAVAQIPVPENGKDADPEVIRQMVNEAVAEIPPAKDGKDADPYEPDPEHIKSLLKGIVQPVLDAIPTPKDGSSVTLDDVRPMIEDAIAKAVAAIPVPKDGERGKDGAGIADLVIDREGNLVATFTDGRMKELGRVVGKDGRDGDPGKDGQDGMGPEDIGLTLMEDGRTVRFSFDKGDTEYAFQIPFPVVLDRGVYAEGREYEEGDGVTWGGSYWIAQRATSQKPDSPDSGWRLAVKRGRDGKDAR